MKIYLIQHGKAGDRERDGERHLTKEGRAESFRVASYMKRIGLKVDEIIHSGKTRAGETAEIFRQELSSGKVGSIDGMNPLDEPREFIKWIQKGDVMYVGHLPHIEKTVALLVTGDPSESVIDVKNSGVICLESSGDKWEIAWYITPEVTAED